MKNTNPGGRPHKFANAAEMSAKVDEYFDSIQREGKRPTIAGMAYFMGYISKQSFYDNVKKDEFSTVLERARLRLSAMIEELLYTGQNCTGAIFALKNLGYEDKTVHSVTKTVRMGDVRLDDGSVIDYDVGEAVEDEDA